MPSDIVDKLDDAVNKLKDAAELLYESGSIAIKTKGRAGNGINSAISGIEEIKQVLEGQ